MKCLRSKTLPICAAAQEGQIVGLAVVMQYFSQSIGAMTNWTRRRKTGKQCVYKLEEAGYVTTKMYSR